MKAMKRAAVACLLVVGGCAGLAGAPPAAAYNLINCGFVNGHILYSVTAETKALSNYPSAAFDAAGSWNATPTKIYFADAGSRSPQMGIDAYNFGNTDFDSITELPGCSERTWTGEPLSIWNRWDTDAYSQTNKKSVMVHELGHALGLEHSAAGMGRCTGMAIMYAYDTRYTTCHLSAPQTDDINGANAWYKN